MTPTIRPATPEDAISLAPRLRAADLDEIKALVSDDPTSVLLESIQMGTETYAGVLDGRVIALFGIHHCPGLAPEEAAVWMLGSDEIRSVGPTLFRETAVYLHRFHQRFPLLWNIVDARNTVHINWLKRFGFVAFKRHEHLGVEQRPFYEFIRIDTSCAPSPQPA